MDKDGYYGDRYNQNNYYYYNKSINNSTDYNYEINNNYALALFVGVATMTLWGYIYRSIKRCIKGYKRDKIRYIQEIDIENSIQNCHQLCAICLEEYTETNKKVCILSCNHTFHIECIKEWWKKVHTCPFCRRDFSI